jgi:glycosyltransferase involved in cell wall biosynthesis
MNWPRLSVVVPNYNHAAYLPRCLEALCVQSLQPFEIVVIDDGSTDNSLEVLAACSRRFPIIRIVRNQQNLGCLPTVRKGLSLVRGDYVFLPSADDEVVPGLFEASMGLLARFPQAGLCCTVSTWRIPERGLEWHMGTGFAAQRCYLSPDDVVGVGRRGRLPIPTSSVILKREAVERCGGYPDDLRWHVDWFVTAVIAFRHGMCYVPEPLSNVYLTPASYSRKGMNSDAQVEVLSRLLDRLNSPDCADVAPRIRDSAALNMFGLPAVRLLLSRPEYRHFFTPLLLLRASHRSLEVTGRRFLPAPFARLVVRLLYQHRSARS